MTKAGMAASTAEWHIVVTHFPAQAMVIQPEIKDLDAKYGIDLMITGLLNMMCPFVSITFAEFGQCPKYFDVLRCLLLKTPYGVTPPPRTLGLGDLWTKR